MNEKENMIVVQVLLTGEQKEALQKYAKRRGQTMSAASREIIVSALLAKGVLNYE